MKIFLNPLAKLGVFIQLSNEQSLTFSADFNFFADSIYFIPAYDEISFLSRRNPLSLSDFLTFGKDYLFVANNN